MPSLK
jgi:hypothetical protein